jgi:hypothetical protein
LQMNIRSAQPLRSYQGFQPYNNRAEWDCPGIVTRTARGLVLRPTSSATHCNTARRTGPGKSGATDPVPEADRTVFQVKVPRKAAKL